MSTNTRITVKSLSARVDTLDASLERIEGMLALLVADAPAKPQPKAARKPAKRKPAAKKAPAKVAKGAQTRESLSRKDWNRTLTAKAKFAGGDTYKRVLASWADMQEARDNGYTPDEALALV